MAKFEEHARSKGDAFPASSRDLSDIIGTWVEDPAFDAALAEQDTIWPACEDAESDGATERANS